MFFHSTAACSFIKLTSFGSVFMISTGPSWDGSGDSGRLDGSGSGSAAGSWDRGGRSGLFSPVLYTIQGSIITLKTV